MLGQPGLVAWEQTAGELIVHTSGAAVVKLFLEPETIPPRTFFLHQ